MSLADNSRQAHVYDESWTDTGEEITVHDIRDAYNGAAGTEKGLALLWGRIQLRAKLRFWISTTVVAVVERRHLLKDIASRLLETDPVTVTHDAITSSAGIQGGDFDTDELQLWMISRPPLWRHTRSGKQLSITTPH